MTTLTLHRTVQLLLALSLFLATAGGAQRAVDLIDQLQARLAHCQDDRCTSGIHPGIHSSAAPRRLC